MKKYLLYIFLLVCFCACSQKQTHIGSDLTSKNYIETMLKTIKHYDCEPMYYLKYAQNICYSEILVNDIPLNKNYKELGSGRTISINNYIFKSGSQKITFRLYPAAKGRDFDYNTLNEETNMKIVITESDNTKRNNRGKEIASYLTPTIDGVNENGAIKIFAATGKTYYEASFIFEAKVPYEFTSLDKGQDLRKWNQEKLEQKVVDFYRNQLALLKDKKKEEYFSHLDLKEKETRQSLFFSKNELQHILNLYLDPFTIPNYQMQPLENYELKFYGNGRIVCLELTSQEAKMRGKSALWGKFGEGDEMVFDFFKFYLYIPEGEDELVMIR